MSTRASRPFRYTEELSFEHVGDPFLLVTESSWTPDGAPLHFERGTLRPLGDGRVDLALAHPIGVAEVAEGTVEGTTVTLRSTAVVRTADRLARDGDRAALSDGRRRPVLRAGHGHGGRGQDVPRPGHAPEGVTVADAPRDLSRVWLATSIVGILAGGVLWLLDLPDAANVAWAATTVVALVSLLRDVIEGIMRRQAGVDVIALLAMGGSLALEEYLAGAVIALMLATGMRSSPMRIDGRIGSSRRCSTARRER